MRVTGSCTFESLLFAVNGEKAADDIPSESCGSDV